MANNSNGNGNGDYFEKPWYKSRKFMAFVLTQVALIAITIVTLLTQKIEWELSGYMFGIVVVMGWTTTLFMGKQAECDMFMRGITVLGGIPDKYKSKFLSMIPPEPKEKGDVPSETPPSSVPPAN